MVSYILKFIYYNLYLISYKLFYNKYIYIFFLVPAQSQRQSIQSLPDDSMLPPPVSQSSGIQKTRKRKCSKEQEEEPLERVTPTNSTATDDSSLIPNSQTSFLISDCNVVEGKRSRKNFF